MKIKAWGGVGGDQCIKNGLEPRAGSRDERGTIRGRLSYFQALPSSSKSECSMDKTQSHIHYFK